MKSEEDYYSYVCQESIKLIRLLSLIKENKIKNFDILCKKTLIALKNKKKIFFYGNGGSAADAQHLATELVVRFRKNRKPISALALTTDTSILTAVSNDFSFKKIFSRQIEALGSPGDIAIAITTSGNSQNLIEANKVANKIGVETFCFSGNKGGRLAKYTNYPIIIKSNNTATVQTIEIMLGQCFCNILEDKIIKNEKFYL